MIEGRTPDAVSNGERRAPVWRRVVVGVVAVVLVAVLGVAYMVVGWQRMDSVCSTDAAVPAGADGASWSYSWSWMPPGFTSTWGDVSIPKLWW